MASVPPPQGMNEIDYEAIEAAVTETVRGRWFLAEYARRNRLAETRQLLDAMARIEVAVSANQGALPSADPSIRLMIQRIKEIAGQLGTIAGDMRAAGVDEHLAEAVDGQARAVSGMMRSASVGGRSEPARLDPPRPPHRGEHPLGTNAVAAAPKSAEPQTRPAPAMPRMPRAEPLSTPVRPGQEEVQRVAGPDPRLADPRFADPRLAALAELDAMPLARKLAVFT